MVNAKHQADERTVGVQTEEEGQRAIKEEEEAEGAPVMVKEEMYKAGFWM